MVNLNKIRYLLDTDVKHNIEYKTKKIKSLIGKYAKRIKPFVYNNGVSDTSFMNESIKILNMNQDGSFNVIFYGMNSNMNKEWDDGNWIESSIIESFDY
jgi:hypothetical protein